MKAKHQLFSKMRKKPKTSAGMKNDNDICNLPSVIWGRILDNLSIEDVNRCMNVNNLFHSQIPSTAKRLYWTENEYSHCNKMRLKTLLARFTTVEDLYILPHINGFRDEEDNELPSTTHTSCNINAGGESWSKPGKSMQRGYVGIGSGLSKSKFPVHLDELALVLPAISALKRVYINVGRIHHGHSMKTIAGSNDLLVIEKKMLRKGDREIKVFFVSERGVISSTENKHNITKKLRKIVEIRGWPFASIKESQQGTIVDWRSLLLLGMFFCHMCLLVGIVPILL